MLIEEELKSLRSTASSARRNFSTLERESGCQLVGQGKCGAGIPGSQHLLLALVLGELWDRGLSRMAWALRENPKVACKHVFR